MEKEKRAEIKKEIKSNLPRPNYPHAAQLHFTSLQPINCVPALHYGADGWVPHVGHISCLHTCARHCTVGPQCHALTSLVCFVPLAGAWTHLSDLSPPRKTSTDASNRNRGHRTHMHATRTYTWAIYMDPFEPPFPSRRRPRSCIKFISHLLEQVVEGPFCGCCVGN